jgi:hypothetical protein
VRNQELRTDRRTEGQIELSSSCVRLGQIVCRCQLVGAFNNSSCWKAGLRKNEGRPVLTRGRAAVVDVARSSRAKGIGESGAVFLSLVLSRASAFAAWASSSP